jgi:hypothetical protein
VALKPFTALLQAAGLQERVASSVRAAAKRVEQTIDEDGLVAFWPRSRGSVSLTAWSYRFLAQAMKAGEAVDKTLQERLAKVLRQALRSDYPRLLSGEEVRERVEALSALAEGGQIEEAYLAELARRADAMPNVALAEAAAVFAQRPGEDGRMQAALLDSLWSRVKILSRNGRPYYAGLAGEAGNPLILPSETRSLAEITRAVALAAPEEPRLAVLRDGLVRLAGGDGWGTTNANAAAIRALAETWQRGGAVSASLAGPGGVERVSFGGTTPVVRRVSTEPAPLRIEGGGAPIVALVDTRFQPVEPGAKARPVAQGFVLSRQSHRVPGGASRPERIDPDAEGVLRLSVGDVVEETAELVNPEDRTFVAIRLPLAAGLEPLNPALATAPAEATPSAGPTLPPTWASYGDDSVLYAYNSLPKGNYRFVFRTRALIPGRFTQPPGEAEMMYQAGVYGSSAGRAVVIARQP